MLFRVMTQFSVSEPLRDGRRVVLVQPVPSLVRGLLLSRRAGLRALMPACSTGEVVGVLLERALTRRSAPALPVGRRGS
ncbi:MAG: hypothetical protein M0Z69_04835 [Actinomycetota bacterium]|nr:hypothetical protein [Actinomycetota bacterium]